MFTVKWEYQQVAHEFPKIKLCKLATDYSAPEGYIYLPASSNPTDTDVLLPVLITLIVIGTFIIILLILVLLYFKGIVGTHRERNNQRQCEHARPSPRLFNCNFNNVSIK